MASPIRILSSTSSLENPPSYDDIYTFSKWEIQAQSANYHLMRKKARLEALVGGKIALDALLKGHNSAFRKKMRKTTIHPLLMMLF